MKSTPEVGLDKSKMTKGVFFILICICFAKKDFQLSGSLFEL